MRIYFLSLLCGILMGCRPPDDKWLSKTHRWNGDAVENSFLVGFCSHENRLGAFSSLREEEEYFQDLSFRYFQNSSLKSVSLISSMQGSMKCSDSLLAELRFHSEGEAFSLLKTWKSRGKIQFWEPNWLNKIQDVHEEAFHLQYAGAGRRWWTENIQLLPALENIRKLSLVSESQMYAPVIAVLDGGIDFEHESLRGRIWENVDGENSSCLGDRWGCNTVHAREGYLGDGNAYPFGTRGAGESCSRNHRNVRVSDCMHATHIAGIIAGRVETGVPGVCPYCKVMNVRVLEEVDGEGRIPDSAVLRGLKYVSSFERAPGKNLVRVVNLSFGKYQKGRALSLYVEHLSKLRDGILVVAAAGNEDSQRRIYPAAHAHVISVAGLAASGRKASYSNYGSWVNIAAPGGELREGNEFTILSSVPGGSLAPSQGTSMASPVLAGVAGLVLALRPHLTASELREILLESADDRLYRESFAGGYNYRNYFPIVDDEHVPLLGVGILDASAAVLGVKRNQIGVKNRERVQLKCSSSAGIDVKKSQELLLFFLFPIFSVFCVLWMERKKSHERFSQNKNS